MRTFFLLAMIGCSTSETTPKEFNNPPVAEIQSHPDGATLAEGYVNQFYAQISDLNHDLTALSVSWYVDEDLACDWEAPDPAGVSRCDIALVPDNTRVSVQVNDPSGDASRDEISVVVTPTEAPTAEITSPTLAGSYYSDQLIAFRANIADAEDEVDLLVATWESSLDGPLVLDTTPDSSGKIEAFGYLSEGQHAIQLRVEDNSGKSSVQSVVIDVGGANGLPSCEITSPDSGSAAIIGETVVFQATVSDPDVPATELAVEWQSDKDGTLGTTTPTSSGEVIFAYDELSTNSHTITLMVSDEVGAVCSDAILFSIGTPPTISITSPTDADVYTVGEGVLFSAEVTDNEDLPSDLSIEWISNIDGQLSTQSPTSAGLAQFSSTDLSAGLHTVLVSVFDSTGLSADAIVSLRVNTPPTVPNVQLSPSIAYTDDGLIVVASGSTDTDGDAVNYAYEWYKNGTLTTHTTATIDASNTTKGDLWTVRVTPNDGYSDGAYAEQSIVIANSLPVISSIFVSPNPPSINDLLTCTAVVSDADGETLAEDYIWTNVATGAVMGVGNTLQLNSSMVQFGQTIQCDLSVSDSDGVGATDSAAVTLQNSAPSISTVSISPTTVSYISLLACSAIASDADGDPITDSFEWSNLTTGSILGQGDTLQLDASLANTGDEIQCQVTVTDVHGESATATTSVTVENAQPVVTSIEILPAQTIYNDSTLICSAVIYDNEDGPLTAAYSWSNTTTGQALGSGSTLVLDSTIAQPMDTIECVATATDSQLAVASDGVSVVVDNRSPSLTTVDILPAVAYLGDTLTCTVNGVSDLDDDNLVTNYQWLVNGVTQSTIGSTLSSGFVRDNVVECTVSVTDPWGALASSTGQITISNTPPTAPTSISITPTAPALSDDLVCSASGSTDADGDSITYVYDWEVDGAVWTGNTSYGGTTISNADTSPGQTWTCFVNADDGTDLGLPSSTTVSLGYSWSGPVTFDSCGVTGQLGPGQSDCDATYAGTALDGEVTLNGGIQYWTVSSSGTYLIEAWGAEGASGTTNGYSNAALGAYSSGEVFLTAGSRLKILVGQSADGVAQGNGNAGGGGGGGTFVALDDDTPIIVAGGGAGTGANQNIIEPTWSPGQASQNGGVSSYNGSNATIGYGGFAGYDGGGGGGFYGDGVSSSVGYGGNAFVNGGRGGEFYLVNTFAHYGFGGFGGGGGAGHAGGGGGGYTGGNGTGQYGNGSWAGGGGSFSSGSNQIMQSGVGAGDGLVVIDKLN